jgi:cytochrome c biogenesis protein CcdA
MLRLLVLMITIGLADSINPSTIAPALYLASGDRPRARVAQFTLSVFLVYLAGGVLIGVGVGQVVRSIIPDIDVQHTVRHVGEIVAGALLLGGAGLIWSRRNRLAARRLPAPSPKRRSSAWLGASITAVELPTAFPYFAAIAAVVGSGLGAAKEFGLLLIFNICFVLPLIGILLTLVLGGERANELLVRGRMFLEHRWPQVLSVLVALVGVIAIFFGATGLAMGIHGPAGRFFRKVREGVHGVVGG